MDRALDIPMPAPGQLAMTSGTWRLNAGVAIVAGAVPVSDEPDVWDRLPSPVRTGFAPTLPTRVGGVVAVTLIPALYLPDRVIRCAAPSASVFTVSAAHAAVSWSADCDISAPAGSYSANQ